jgi:selenocysteine lyase/cysteine desulfurase
VDLSRIHRRAFYIAGGYKYAMSGEGACWLAIPPGCTLRPADTGWYASFDTLSVAVAPGAAVPYSSDAFRFWGATFDPSGLYRFGAAMDWLRSTGTTIAQVHAHSHRLQERFLAALERASLPGLAASGLVVPTGAPRGNFLAFDVDGAEEMHQRITAEHVTIDRRGRRLRFGFGVYHEDRDVDLLIEALNRALR